MTIRRWPRLTVAWILAALIGGAAAGQPGPRPAAARPNVLVIMGDDHAAYALGCDGSAVAKTPHLDRLAAAGARFTRAYCNSPVCTASRQSLLTGRLPHAVGVTLLATPLPERELTLAEHLKAAGYETAAIGKMHFNSALFHGFDRRVDHPEYQAWLKARAPLPLPEGVRTAPAAFRPFVDPARVWLNSECLPYPAREADMEATCFAEEADRFLRRRRDRPFYLVVSFYQPHSPFHFPVEDAGRVRPGQVAVPAVGPEDPPQIPLVFRDLTEAEKRGINAAYYTSVAFLDRSVGRVLQALTDGGQEADTLVFYAGDHGYNLGHHGRFEKHCFYEEAVRAPLLARWPGRIPAGRVIGALTELVDLFPTVCDAAALPTPPDRHGRSLLPLLTAATDSNRDQVVSQYHENEEAMLRTADWKLIYGSGRRARQDGYATENPTPGRMVRLYDLRRDPGERHNLAANPQQAARVWEMEVGLLDRLRATAAPGHAAPAGLPVVQQLDWYLVPPESRLRPDRTH